MTRAIRRFLTRNRRSAPVRFIVSLARSVVKADENLDYDHRQNGESFALAQTAARDSAPILFDVGANKGDWTALALDLAPQATIHAFEIVPEVQTHFAARFADRRNVRLNRAGVSDLSGEISVKVPRDRERSSTIFGYQDESSDETIAARVVSGDDYCREAKIDRIDFLKIDVEGGESRVLKGFADTLRQGRVRAIQFEYGYTSIYARFLLRDFYEWLEPQGYVLGKMYPNEVTFSPYRPEMETFIGPNYLAVRREERAWIDALSAKAG